MTALEIIRQFVPRFACCGLEHKRRILPRGSVGDRSRITMSIPSPLGSGHAAHTVVNLVTILYGVPPCCLYRIQIGIGLLVSQCIRRLRVVSHRDDIYRRRVRVILSVRTLDFEHIARHNVFLPGMIYFPCQLLLSVVYKPLAGSLILGLESIYRQIMDLVVCRDIDRIGVLNLRLQTVLRTLGLHGDKEAANHIVAIDIDHTGSFITSNRISRTIHPVLVWLLHRYIRNRNLAMSCRAHFI